MSHAQRFGVWAYNIHRLRAGYGNFEREVIAPYAPRDLATRRGYLNYLLSLIYHVGNSANRAKSNKSSCSWRPERYTRATAHQSERRAPNEVAPSGPPRMRGGRRNARGRLRSNTKNRTRAHTEKARTRMYLRGPAYTRK